MTRVAYTPALALARMFVLPGATYQDPEISWRYAVPPSGLGFVAGNGLGHSYAGTMWTGEARTTDVTGGTTGTFAGGALDGLPPHAGPGPPGPERRSPPRRPRRRQRDTYPLPVGTNPNATSFKFDGNESESLLIGQNFGIITDIQTGPDGGLYVVSNTDGAVYRISRVQ